MNFELSPDRSYEWSQESDFGLKANLVPEYLANSKLEEAMANMENEYPGMNCIKTGLPGKLTLSKRKGLREVLFS